jgi:LmbE family N-acetylglucosaminyl deacetylase
LLVLAPHQDDCVIIAGGAAIQNAKLGGASTIVYLTRDANPHLAEIRIREAKSAWRLLAPAPVDLVFLDFISDREGWNAERVTSARTRLRELIAAIRPDRIIAPLVEGGHSEHDLVGRLAIELVGASTDIDLLLASEYNPYLVAERTPGKLLRFIIRLLPFIPYDSPTYGLTPSRQRLLLMHDDELGLKIRMLKAFESQADTIPISQFGYPDLYEAPGPLPRFTIDVVRQHLSWWSVITLSLIMLAACAAGLVCSQTIGMAIGALCLAAFVYGWLITPGTLRNYLSEEWLFVLPLLGALAARTVAFGVHRRRA